MDSKKVRDWLELYFKAWRSPGTALLTGLFTQAVDYRVSPWKNPIHSLEALRPFWEQARAGSHEAFELKSEIIAIENDTAVVRLEVTYSGDSPDKWRDLWILKFNRSGLCYSFEEWPFAPDQEDGQSI